MKKIVSILVLISIIGTVIFSSVISRWNIGIYPDSVTYLSTAENIQAGKGVYFVKYEKDGMLLPLVTYPPLYPITLSAMPCKSILSAALCLNAGLFAVNIFLIGFFIFMVTKSVAASSFGAILVQLYSGFIEIHAVALSEPLYLALSSGAVIFLLAYLNGMKRTMLLVSSLLVALASLTRYSVGGLLLIFAILLIINKNRILKEKLLDIVVFSALSLTPFLFWMARNYLHAGSLTNRVMVYHPPSLSNLRTLLDTITGWLYPFSVNSNPIKVIIVLISTALFVIAIILTLRIARNSKAAAPGYSVCVVSLAGLTLFLMFSVFFIDDLIALDYRALIYHFIFILVLSISAFRYLHTVFPGKVYRSLFIIASVYISLNYICQGIIEYRDLYNDGRGYTGKIWASSRTLDYLRNIPADFTVYTNHTPPVFFRYRRNANYIPKLIHGISGKQNEKYEETLEKMNADFVAGKAVLIWFNEIELYGTLSLEQIIEKTGLEYSIYFQDGSIYGKRGFGLLAPNRPE